MQIPIKVPNAPWPEERVQRMKELLQQGMSTGRVARELGVTRNAIIGKVHRLGLIVGDLNGKKPVARGQHRPRPRLSIFNIMELVKIRPRLRYKAPTKVPVMPKAVVKKPVASATGCTIMELTHLTCRWPMWGDTDTSRFYCGQEIMASGEVYCAEHYAASLPQPVKREPSRPFFKFSRSAKPPKSTVA